MHCSMPGFLFFTISQSLLKLMSIKAVMPFNHLSFICFSFPRVSAELPLGSSRDRGFQRPPKALPNVVAAPSWVPQAPSLAQPAGPHLYLPMAPANRTKMHIHPVVMT